MNTVKDKNINTPHQENESDLLMQNEVEKRKDEIKRLKEEIKNLKSQKKNLIQKKRVRVEIKTEKDTLKIYRLTTSPQYSKTPEKFLKTVYTDAFHLLRKNFSVISCLDIRLVNTQSEREEILHHPMTKSKFPILDDNDKKNYLNSLPNYFLEKIVHPNLEGSGWRQNGINFLDLTLVKTR